MSRALSALWVAMILGGGSVFAHPPGADGRHDDRHQVDPAKVRTWTNARTGEVVRGAFLAARRLDSAGGGVGVSIEREGGDVVVFALAELVEADRAEAQRRIDEVRAVQEPAAGQVSAKPAPVQAGPFGAFAPLVATRWDDRWLYVESDGLPHAPPAPGTNPEEARKAFTFSHPMMVGITAWQQQVPLPQAYRGANAWQIPLVPRLAEKPVSAKEQLFRGAIALAANGVPIFNPIKNDGKTDTFLAGELDEFGGHCGRADDYHYHIAPTHLQRFVGKGQPIAYALDGFPIYGLFDPAAQPDGPDAERCCPLGSREPLDALNGHFGATTRGPGPDGTSTVAVPGLYHYHASVKYPYLNGGMRGVVTVKDDQIDPQPRAMSPRAALPPLRGAKITGFKGLGGAMGKETDPAWSLEYVIGGRKHLVNYRLENAKWIFDFVDPTGATKTETYDATSPQRRQGGGGGGREGRGGERRPPPPREGDGDGRRPRLEEQSRPDDPAPLRDDATGRPARQAPEAAAGGAARWVTPAITAPRVSHHEFDSVAAKARASYHLYTPRAYEREPQRRFPVVFWLHGSGGGLSGISVLAARFDAAIDAGKMPPCLVVFVNGLPEGMYVDWKDGSTPVESVIVKDLVPHIDATYRTIAAREGRVLDGFSMGGYGAARLGFKFHGMFGAVSMMGAGPMQAELVQTPRAGRRRAAEVLEEVYGGDQGYFRAVSPRTLAEQNAASIAAGLLVRQVVGDLDETYANNVAFHEHLGRVKIPHRWTVLPGVGHEPVKVIDALGDGNWAFYAEAFARAKPAAPAAPAEIDSAEAPQRLTLSSVDVTSGRLAIDCTCDSKVAPRAPVLSWGVPPEGTKAFAVVMHHIPPSSRENDAHVYMVVANIPAAARELAGGDGRVGTWGQNTVNRRNAYAPPCSQGPGDKTYTITLYALSAETQIPAGTPLKREALLAAIKDTTLATATLDVKYARAGDDRNPRPRPGR